MRDNYRENFSKWTDFVMNGDVKLKRNMKNLSYFMKRIIIFISKGNFRSDYFKKIRKKTFKELEVEQALHRFIHIIKRVFE